MQCPEYALKCLTAFFLMSFGDHSSDVNEIWAGSALGDSQPKSHSNHCY